MLPDFPEGATLERTRIVTERAVEYLMKNPAVEYVQSVVGSSPRVGTSQARSELTVILKPWEERDSQTIDNIMAHVILHMQCKNSGRIRLCNKNKEPLAYGEGCGYSKSGHPSISLSFRADINPIPSVI